MERPKIIPATVPRQLECVKNHFSSRLNKLERFCTYSYFALSEFVGLQSIRSTLVTQFGIARKSLAL